MNLKCLTSIEGKLFDQESKQGIRIFGSILIALSGLILFTDKVIKLELVNNHGFPDTQTFIWVLTQSLSPFLMTIAIPFKPFKTAYLIPTYFYSIQLYWVFDPTIQFDDSLLQAYAIGVCTMFLFLAYTLKGINKIKSKKDKEKELALAELKETINTIKQNS
ncbi:hypothetical protein PL373_09370 [Tenacibaculum maritimum]|nr:hypothetical protein [Tenacibaculum maritimum]MDB0601354.1 hypothetical protein [Tenacibaculum maritimum]MDB0611775.1 hypothetical protein [Tenacibaculum maritimum]